MLPEPDIRFVRVNQDAGFVHFSILSIYFNIITAPSPAKADCYILTASCRGTIGDDSDQGHQDSLHLRTHTLDWTGLTLWAGLEWRWICANEVWTPLEVARIGYRGTGFGDQTTPGE